MHNILKPGVYFLTFALDILSKGTDKSTKDYEINNLIGKGTG